MKDRRFWSPYCVARSPKVHPRPNKVASTIEYREIFLMSSADVSFSPFPSLRFSLVCLYKALMITKNIIQSKIKIIPTGRISPNQKGHSKGLQLYVKCRRRVESNHCALNTGSENGLGTWVRIITEQSGNEANSTAWNETKENDLE